MLFHNGYGFNKTKKKGLSPLNLHLIFIILLFLRPLK